TVEMLSRKLGLILINRGMFAYEPIRYFDGAAPGSFRLLVPARVLVQPGQGIVTPGKVGTIFGEVRVITCQVLRDRQRLLTMLDRFFLAGQATRHLGETQKGANPLGLKLRIFAALLDELLVKGRFGL